MGLPVSLEVGRVSAEACRVPGTGQKSEPLQQAWRCWRRCAGPIAHVSTAATRELGDVRRESMPSLLCAVANKFEHLTSFELFVFTFRERQIPRIAGNAIDAAHDADITGGCTFHAE